MTAIVRALDRRQKSAKNGASGSVRVKNLITASVNRGSTAARARRNVTVAGVAIAVGTVNASASDQLSSNNA